MLCNWKKRFPKKSHVYRKIFFEKFNWKCELGAQAQVAQVVTYRLLGGGGGFGVSLLWGLPALIWGPAQEKYMSVRARNMSVDKNTATETTFPPPDGLEQRFLGLAHPPPLLFRQFLRFFCQNHEKP